MEAAGCEIVCEAAAAVPYNLGLRGGKLDHCGYIKKVLFWT